MLEIDSVDWHLLENGRNHRTDKYEILHTESVPVLRRAQPFKLSISFKNRPFNETTDKIKLLFNYDKKIPEPRVEALMENTMLISSNKMDNSKIKWSVQIEGQKKNTVTVLVRSPSFAYWGEWSLKIKISHKLHTKVSIWQGPTFWLLFNPWSKDDEVYMPNSKYLDEYVLNDVGKIYTTSPRKPIGMKWIYGQFAAPILKVLKKLMSESHSLKEEELGSPVYLAQVFTEVYSIILGNWGGPFDEGTAPWLWTGSVPIYEGYLTTELPAKWAQCFVYAGILTTALRAAGIPARNVTNFLSSTGGFRTMGVNYIFDASGEAINSPMIWNFHVWNDCWMARNDLPEGNGGWQALDCMGYGPGPIEAIKKGNIKIDHDTQSFMAECNADRVRWTKDENGELHMVKVDTAYVGRAMLTKQPFIFDPHGDTDFQDLITLYKEPEGSKEERMAVYNAIRHCKQFNEEMIQLIRESEESFNEEDLPEFYKPLYHINMPVQDKTVDFELEPIESIGFGEPFNAVLKIQNLGEKPITVESYLGCSAIYYNNAIAGRVKKEIKSTVVKPKSKGVISVLVKPEEYAAKLVEFTLLKIHCIATIKENNFTWANDFNFNVEMPEIIITSKNNLEVNKEGTLLFQFKNLLKVKLTKCTINYEAPGIGRNVKIHCRDIKADEDAIIGVNVKPLSSGDILINAIFSSQELNFLGGSSYVEVH